MITKKQGFHWAGKILLPISFAASAMLFVYPGAGFSRNLLIALLIGVAFCLFGFEKYACQGGIVSLLGWLLGAAAGCVGVFCFRSTWASSRLFWRLQNIAMLDQVHMIFLLGLLIAVLAVPAIASVLSLPLHLAAGKMKARPRMDDAWARLKQNWYLPLSAAAFFTVWTEHEGAMVYECIAMVLSMIFSAWLPALSKFFQKQNLLVKVLACLGTVGMCQFLRGCTWYYGRLNIPMAILSAPFVIAWMLVFWEKVDTIFRESRVFSDISRWEWCLYGLLVVFTLFFCVLVYSKTAAFHTATTDYDILHDVIYTSDSPYIARKNAYLDFANSENDIRSPLFALFSAPFSALAYLPGTFFHLSMFDGLPLLLNLGQIIVLFLSFLLLAQASELQPGQRAVFLTVAFFTYAYQLFSLMMEQYIYACFWLSLAVFLFCHRGKAEPIALLGAGGTMLTSLVLVPFMTGENPKKSFRQWFCTCSCIGITFLLLIFGVGRGDILVDLGKMQAMESFLQIKLDYSQKWAQYSWFVRNIFLAPKAGPELEALGHASWQLLPITSVSITGVLLFIASLACCVWGRKKRICQCCGGWILFSLLVLLVMGWGTTENGLILYSLYFGWAFLAAIFHGLCSIAEKTKLRWLVPVFGAAAVLLLIIVNVPEMERLIKFAAEFYPRLG